MIAGVPYAPVSAPYSLVAKDFAKLKAIMALLSPGLVFVDDGVPFAAALEAAVPAHVEIVGGANPPAYPPRKTLEAMLATKPAEPTSTALKRKSGQTRSPSSCSPRARPVRPRA